MTAWFARVGMPLDADEEAAVVELMRSMAPHTAVVVAALGSWAQAAAFVRAAERDSLTWDQEEEEREALWMRASEQRTEGEVLRLLDANLRGLDAEVRAAALAAVRRAGGGRRRSRHRGDGNGLAGRPPERSRSDGRRGA